MKTLIISLLLLFTVQAQDGVTRFYISPDGNGGNGNSWATAWTMFDSSNGWGATSSGLNWQALSSGDTVFVHGEPDDTTFYNAVYIQPIGENDGEGLGTTLPTYAAEFDPPVIIMPSQEVGHNGKVVFGIADENSIFTVQGIKGVTFSGITVMPTTLNGITPMALIRGADIIFDNMHFAGNGYCPGVGLQGDRITIQNSLIDQKYSDGVEELDLLGNNEGRGGRVLKNNVIIYRNGNVGTDSHRDMYQMSNMGQLALAPNYRVDVVIANNLFIDTRPGGSSWNAGLYMSGAYVAANFYVYNNIIVSRKTATSYTSIWMGTPGPANPGDPDYPNEWQTHNLAWKSNMYCFNNTVIGKGTPESRILNFYNYDSLFVHNNLFIIDTTNSSFPIGINLYDPNDSMYYKIDYNAYFEKGGLSGDFSEGDGFGYFDWTDWTTTLVDGGYFDNNSFHGDADNVTFTAKYDTNIVSYYTVTGRDSGLDLATAYPYLLARQPDIAYDILGNPRSGTWDIGALNYPDSVATPTRVRMRAIIIQ